MRLEVARGRVLRLGGSVGDPTLIRLEGAIRVFVARRESELLSPVNGSETDDPVVESCAERRMGSA
jgi:hypothetical protein